MDQMTSLIEKGLALVRIENENAQTIAVQRPRDEERVRERALTELERAPEFARKAFYVIPYKDRSGGEEKTVEVKGLSIHAARALSRIWGNIAVRVRFADDTGEEIILDGAVVDLETNFRDSKERKVSKKWYSKKTKTMEPLREDRLLQAIESASSKLERNLLLATMPVGLKEEYFQSAMSIASGGAKKGKRAAPLAKRIDAMFGKFSEESVTREQIFAYLKVDDTSKISEEMVGRMIGIYNAILDGEAKSEDIFVNPNASDEEKSRAQDIVNEMLKEPEATA